MTTKKVFGHRCRRRPLQCWYTHLIYTYICILYTVPGRSCRRPAVHVGPIDRGTQHGRGLQLEFVQFPSPSTTTTIPQEQWTRTPRHDITCKIFNFSMFINRTIMHVCYIFIQTRIIRVFIYYIYTYRKTMNA